jgi:PAS domain S-box-containing protein
MGILGKYLNFSSLRVHLGLLVLLAILPMLGLLLYSYLEERSLAISNVEGDVQQLAGTACAFQEELVEGTRQLLVALAGQAGVQEQNAWLCSQHLAEIAKDYSRYANLGVIMPDGEPFCLASPTVRQESFKQQAWFRQTVESHDLVIAEGRGGYTAGRLALNLSYPVMDQTGKVSAVVFAALDLDQLNQITGEVQMPDETEFLLINRKGTVLAYLPDPEKWVGKTLRELPLISAILNQGQDIVDLSGLDGVDRLYAFAPLRSTVETGLYVCVGIPTAIAYSGANQTLMRHLIGLGLILLLALAAVWIGGDILILRRIHALAGAARRLSSGDMKARTGLKTGTSELDRLAGAFDEMATALEQQAIQLCQAETKYRSLVEQLPVIAYMARLDETRSPLYISPQVQSILGFTPDAWTADPLLWLRQIHPSDRPQVMEQLSERQSSTGTGGFKLEYRIYSHDRRLLHFFDEALIVQGGDSGALCLHGVMRDITDQKQAQLQLFDYQEQLRSLTSELSLAEERERRRIATDLHDRVGQALAVCKIKLGALGKSEPASGLEIRAEEIRDLIEQAIQETRSLIFKISSPILYELGFEAAVGWLAEEMEKQHSIVSRYLDDGQLKPLDDDIRALLFRAVSELLMNVAKHAQASHVKISTERAGDRIRVVVEDDGIGLESSQMCSRWDKNQGFGLFSIRERLKHVNGSLDIQSRPGKGTRICVTAPLKETGLQGIRRT